MYFPCRSYQLVSILLWFLPEGSDADEAKFRRRKKRSMAKARSLCLPMNFDPEDVSTGSVIRDRSRIGASLADVDPMSIDRWEF